MNVDGSYWMPEQYPKTTWVVAKGPSVDPSTLSGFTSANPIIIDESFDANYKLFRNQNAEKCLPGILVLTAGTNHLLRRSGYPKVVLKVFP